MTDFSGFEKYWKHLGKYMYATQEIHIKKVTVQLFTHFKAQILYIQPSII